MRNLEEIEKIINEHKPILDESFTKLYTFTKE